jgi:hypothetical protein
MAGPQVQEFDMSPNVDPEEDVELGAQVEARTRGRAGAVVAVRVPRDLLARISEYAKLRGLTVSEVMREGAERLVGGTVQLTHYVSGPHVEGPRIIPGSPSHGGRSQTMDVDEVKTG